MRLLALAWVLLLSSSSFSSTVCLAKGQVVTTADFDDSSSSGGDPSDPSSSTAASQSSSRSSDGAHGSSDVAHGSSSSDSTSKPFFVVPAGQLGAQLLSPGGIDTDSPVKIYTDYGDANQQLSSSLRPDTEPGKNVFVSVLVAPRLKANVNEPGAAFTTFDLDDPDALGPRTQLYYNCTSTSNITNLLEDPNVMSLVSYNVTTAENVTSVDENGAIQTVMNITATATLRIQHCSQQQNYSVGQILVRNAFFGEHLTEDGLWPFRVVSKDSKPTSENASSCLVHLEMVQATLSDVYPNCQIKFSSTDMASLTQTASEQETVRSRRRRRLDNKRAFEFVRDPRCSKNCGQASGDDVDECRTSSNEKLSCSVQWYEQVPDCVGECGNNGLPSSQCTGKKSFSLSSCKSGYVRVDVIYCAKIVQCRAISESEVSTPKSLSWNLNSAGQIVDPNYVFVDRGDCSRPTDPRSDCCRITCENCYIDINLAALHADVDGIKANSNAKVIGKASLTFAVVAPNGCSITTDPTKLFDVSFSFGFLGGLFSVDVSAKLSRRYDFTLKPKGAEAKFGWLTTVDARAGSLSNKPFKDVVIDTTMDRTLGNSAIDVSAQVTYMAQVGATIKLLKVIGVGVRVDWDMYARVDAQISFPEPLPSRALVAYNPNSRIKIGDCSRPHFMAFEGTAGVRNAAISLVFWLWGLGDTKLGSWNLPSLSRSVFSGCIASSYEAQLLLVTAADKILSLDTSTRKRLIKMLAWALGFPDIDIGAINIKSVNSANGSIEVSLLVPPSVGEVYPESADFQLAATTRAQSSQFREVMASEVGFQVASMCDDGLWGPDCTQQCTSSSCRTMVCNAVDGETISCDSCLTGYWGPKCENSCTDDGVHQCAEGARVCDKQTGEFMTCDACRRGSYGSTCTSTCPPTQHCNSPACTQNEGDLVDCTSCDITFWEPKCNATCVDDGIHRCAQGGLSCDQGNGSFVSCSSCRQGYWDDVCSSACPQDPVCNSPTCTRSSGEVTMCDSCATSFWGSTCRKFCPEDGIHHCANGTQTCKQSSGSFMSCGECLYGYYRKDCTHTCPPSPKCIGPSCARLTGKTSSCKSCEPGFWDTTCNKACAADDIHHCAINATSCEQTSGNFTECTACKQGYWGSDCTYNCTIPTHCVGSICSQKTGVVESCTACETGFWGPQCENTCADDGVHKCSEGARVCDKKTGQFKSCTSCQRGLWGSGCTNKCSAPSQCHSPTCRQNNGSLVSCESCSVGFWDTKCDSACTTDPDNHCAVGTISCEKTMGNFTKCMSCEHGFWDANCTSRCSMPYSCSGAVCAQTTGILDVCTGCETGNWGPKCERKCVDDGVRMCVAGGQTCDKTSGAFVSCSSCRAGYWQDTCTQACEPIPNCAKPTCSRSSGERISCDICTPGYWGTWCDSACLSDTVHHCNATSTPTCAKSNGVITSCTGCSDGFWGPSCAAACVLPENCKSGGCAQFAGELQKCTACADGYDGLRCEHSTKGTSSSMRFAATLALQLLLATVVAVVALSIR